MSDSKWTILRALVGLCLVGGPAWAQANPLLQGDAESPLVGTTFPMGDNPYRYYRW